jgi:hypothetical protein
MGIITNMKIIFRLYSSPVIEGDKIEKNEMGGECSADGEGRGCTGFWWGNPRERDHWGDPGVDARIIVRWIFRKGDVGKWTGLSWLRIETGVEHL